MNVPRLTTRNRRHWQQGEELIRLIAEDGRVDGHELADLLDWHSGGEALAACIDLNGARDRAVSLPQVQALDREYSAWLPRLPES
jgi:hypothetical protein